MTTLVMLHGLGATSEVWRGVEELLDCDWLAPDLPGHGRSARLPSYSFDDYATALLPLLPPDREVHLLGHSMGGMVALAMAARAPQVTGVTGFGVKVHWPPEDVAGAAAAATRAPSVFATREEAAERYLRLSGLRGLVSVDDVGVGVEPAEGGWTLAQDPGTFGFGTPDIRALLAGVSCPVTLARGEHDPMVTDEHLAAVVPSHVTLPGVGHNCHVEAPAAVLSLLA